VSGRNICQGGDAPGSLIILEEDAKLDPIDATMCILSFHSAIFTTEGEVQIKQAILGAAS